MKPVRKGDCPSSLSAYAAAHPRATWGEMRRTDRHVYYDIKEQLLRDQHNLCAYCECRIGEDTFQVEHFHPKSDTTNGRNLHLDWNNLLGTCCGGNEAEGIGTADLPRRRRADKKNMSCGERKRDKHWEKFLNPLRIPPFPAAFCLNQRQGALEPNEKFCRAYPELHAGQTVSTRDLLQSTVDELNLNCDRLCQERLEVIRFVEEQKQEAREAGKRPGDILPLLARRFFGKSWLPYFTTIRCCLGPAAEDFLRSINFEG